MKLLPPVTSGGARISRGGASMALVKINVALNIEKKFLVIYFLFTKNMIKQTRLSGSGS